MAKIKLSSGFSIIPEGVYTFCVGNVKHDVDFGKLTISCVTQDGKKHDEQYSFLKQDGQVNEGAIKAFSFFARRVLNNGALEEIDPTELVGHYFRARVEHKQTEKRDKPGEYWTNVSLQDIEMEYGFAGQDVAAATPTTVVDVCSVLGI